MSFLAIILNDLSGISNIDGEPTSPFMSHYTDNCIKCKIVELFIQVVSRMHKSDKALIQLGLNQIDRNSDILSLNA